MWDDLNGLSEIVTTALSSQHRLINTAGCRIGGTREILIDETLIVTKVEVGFATIISHEHFTMFEGIHRAWVDVDVRVKLLHRDTKTTHLEQTTKRRCCQTFSKGTCNATRHENVLWHCFSRQV